MGRTRMSISNRVDSVFFVFAGAATVWLAWLILAEGFRLGLGQVWFYIPFWAVLAYLALPRLHRILTYLYVPDYFIGRTRTSDGLLGDPVNLALRGDESQLHGAMLAAGWIRADDLSFRSALGIVKSTLLRRSYHRAPVSPLLLFSRQQDFAYQQEVDGNPAKRHHVRFWRAPDGWMLPGGIPVDWLAAGTFDRAVGFSLFTLQITHKIDENTDTERDHIISTVTTAEPSAVVAVIKDFSTGYHSRNGGGDTIQTDGDLPILDVTAVTGRKDAVIAPEVWHRRRPAPVIVAAALIAARAVLLVVFGLIAYGSNEFVVEFEKSGITAQEGLAVTIGTLAVFAVIQLIFGVFVVMGSNVARVIVLFVSTVSIITYGIDFVTGGSQLSQQTNLVSLAIDILVLLALSSDRSSRWARMSRKDPLAGTPLDKLTTPPSPAG
ncbi:MAG: LssY C-terminal domain-containing protein [Rhodoglobus sp.]